MTDNLVAMLRKCEYVGRESGADFVGITSTDARKAADRIEELEAALFAAKELTNQQSFLIAARDATIAFLEAENERLKQYAGFYNEWKICKRCGAERNPGTTPAHPSEWDTKLDSIEAERDELREALIRIAVEEKAKLIYERMP
jgi:hypothetical protein